MATKTKSTKSKRTKKAKEEKVEEQPRPYTVAKCQWCGMKWKHYGDDTPEHFCGKVCASHEVIQEPTVEPDQAQA